MRYYERTIKVRKPINQYGKIGYVPTYEYVMTDDISKYNYRKVWKFYESREAAAFFSNPNRQPDHVYQVEVMR